LPKTNYKYEKRQKDIAKQKKRAEKLKRRQEKKQQEEAPVVNGGGTAGQGQGETGSDPAVED
jgi:ribosomal protein L4